MSAAVLVSAEVVFYQRSVESPRWHCNAPATLNSCSVEFCNNVRPSDDLLWIDSAHLRDVKDTVTENTKGHNGLRLGGVAV